MVIAATAGTAVVQSATKEDGIVNQAFKLTVLIGLGLAIGIGIYLIYNLTGILQDIFTPVTATFKALGPVTDIILAPITFGLSLFTGRR